MTTAPSTAARVLRASALRRLPVASTSISARRSISSFVVAKPVNFTNGLSRAGLRSHFRPVVAASRSASTASTASKAFPVAIAPSAAATIRASPASPLLLRNVSTASTPPPSTPASETTETAAPLSAPEEQPLDWNTFFVLRKKRRRWQVASSALFAALGVTGGSLVLGSGAMDWLVGQFPLDPMIALGILTIAFGVMGWLLGPPFGSQIFYIRNRKWKPQMTRKEVEFFQRIRKNRVDPSNSSAGNPVPDFYGEKIQSVTGYRQWLRDQRAFNKKRVTFV